jgi:hypothetical protein
VSGDGSVEHQSRGHVRGVSDDLAGLFGEMPGGDEDPSSAVVDDVGEFGARQP